MFYINFDNENDVTDLRFKYKDDRIVVEMLNKIEDLQEQVRTLQSDAVEERNRD